VAFAQLTILVRHNFTVLECFGNLVTTVYETSSGKPRVLPFVRNRSGRPSSTLGQDYQ
jgi:hypothetical protein